MDFLRGVVVHDQVSHARLGAEAAGAAGDLELAGSTAEAAQEIVVVQFNDAAVDGQGACATRGTNPARQGIEAAKPQRATRDGSGTGVGVVSRESDEGATTLGQATSAGLQFTDVSSDEKGSVATARQR